MTAVLLPSSVGLYSERFLSAKVRHVGKELYHLRDNSTRMRLLTSDQLCDFASYMGNRQTAKFAIHNGRKDELCRPSGHLEVGSKQDNKRIQDAPGNSHELPTKRVTRNAGTADEKPVDLQREACVRSRLTVAGHQKEPLLNPTETNVNENVLNASRKRKCVETDLKKRPCVQTAVDGKQTDIERCRRSTRRTSERTDSFSTSNDCKTPSTETTATTVFSLTSDVVVPTWRVLKVHKLFKLEGTENLTDEAFLKRHQRHEMDEKRRKRWDLQRQRELSFYENARREDSSTCNMTACNQANNCMPSSPSSSDTIEVAYVEVVDDSSQSAFGISLPNISREEFRLPWCLETDAKPQLSKQEQRQSSAPRRKVHKRFGKRQRRKYSS